MEQSRKKSTGFYPTPRALAKSAILDHLLRSKKPPEVIIEPAAGAGDLLLATWECLLEKYNLTKIQIEEIVANTFAYETDETIFEVMKENIRTWLKMKKINSRPQLILSNFLLHAYSMITKVDQDVLVVCNPPWDEFTTRKHDYDENRTQRQQEKKLASGFGYRNLYQIFLDRILSIESQNLTLLFFSPRQLMGDLSAHPLRKILLDHGVCHFSVFKNSSIPQFRFDSVDPNLEIAVLSYMRSEYQAEHHAFVRRGMEQQYQPTRIHHDDCTIPCPPSNESSILMNKILSQQALSGWTCENKISVSRGKVDYQCINYADATNSRNTNAYNYETAGETTSLIVNKILPNSKRKVKAAIIKSSEPLSDSMLRISIEERELQDYLLLILNSRPVELALRSLTTNINLNNYRLLSLPAPVPTTSQLRKARDLCKKCHQGTLSWERASDEIAQDVFCLSLVEIECLRKLFPDRKFDKCGAPS